MVVNQIASDLLVYGSDSSSWEILVIAARYVFADIVTNTYKNDIHVSVALAEAALK
jgi:hypothetical protein